MAILDALKDGQPEYPLYQPDSWEFKAPKGLLTYAALMGGSSTSKSGSSKKGAKPFPGMEGQHQYVTEKKQLFDEEVADVSSRLMSGMKMSGDPLGYIKTDEGKALVEELTVLNRKATKLAENKQFTEQNYEAYVKNEAIVNSTKKSGGQYDYNPTTGQYTGIITKKDGSFEEVSASDVATLWSNGAIPITVQDKNDLINKYYTADANGVIRKPQFSTGFDSSADWTTKMTSYLERLKTTSGGDLGFAAQDVDVGTDVYGNPNKYVFKHGTYEGNYSAWLTTHGAGVKNLLEGDDLASAKEAYNRDLWNGDPDAWEYETKQNAQGQDEYIEDEDAMHGLKSTKRTFDEWLEQKIIEQKTGLQTYKPSIGYTTMDNPNAAGGGGGTGDNVNYWELLEYDQSKNLLGEKNLDWKTGVLDLGEVAANLSKVNGLTSTSASYLLNQYKTAAKEKLKATGYSETSITDDMINKTAWNLVSAKDQKTIIKGVISAQTQAKTGEEYTALARMYPGLTVWNPFNWKLYKDEKNQITTALMVGPENVQKYGADIIQTSIRTDVQVNNGITFDKVSKHNPVGVGMTAITDFTATNKKEPMIIKAESQFVLNGKPYTNVVVLVDKSDAALSKLKGYLPNTSGELELVDYTDPRIKQFIKDGSFLETFGLNVGSLTAEEGLMLTTNGYTAASDDFYMVPLTIDGDWVKDQKWTTAGSSKLFTAIESGFINNMATDVESDITTK